MSGGMSGGLSGGGPGLGEPLGAVATRRLNMLVHSELVAVLRGRAGPVSGSGIVFHDEHAPCFASLSALLQAGDALLDMPDLNGSTALSHACNRWRASLASEEATRSFSERAEARPAGRSAFNLYSSSDWEALVVRHGDQIGGPG